jgi:hypothetical protein
MSDAGYEVEQILLNNNPLSLTPPAAGLEPIPGTQNWDYTFAPLAENQTIHVNFKKTDVNYQVTLIQTGTLGAAPNLVGTITNTPSGANITATASYLEGTNVIYDFIANAAHINHAYIAELIHDDVDVIEFHTPTEDTRIMDRTLNLNKDEDATEGIQKNHKIEVR